ncbi:hypothetical protein C3L33_12109, partial [Rhododendron williamsianum]
MQSYLWVGPASVDGGGGMISPCANRSLLVGPRRRRWAPVVASAAVNGGKSHYAVLGISPSASSGDIKKAYRLLALKYHPDVSKDSRADEVFKNIRLAYDYPASEMSIYYLLYEEHEAMVNFILSNERSRNQYDRALRFQEDTSRQSRGNWGSHHEFEDELRIYRWSDLRQRMQRQKYGGKSNVREESSSFDDEADEVSEDETAHEERGPFIEVLRSALLSLFLMRTIGAQLSLTFSSLMALFDRKLDAGYKVGYLIAWVLGGSGGVLLTLCLSFASWFCGKTSSSLVTLVVVAMWVGSNLARYAPVPQGALLTLLYMSIKLQTDRS